MLKLNDDECNTLVRALDHFLDTMEGVEPDLTMTQAATLRNKVRAYLTSNDPDIYLACIGERVIRVRGRNLWEAATRAVGIFVKQVREGTTFLEGKATMTVARNMAGGASFKGDVEIWKAQFAATGRKLPKSWTLVAKET